MTNTEELQLFLENNPHLIPMQINIEKTLQRLPNEEAKLYFLLEEMMDNISLLKYKLDYLLNKVKWGNYDDNNNSTINC